jgi:hypothetical protein
MKLLIRLTLLVASGISFNSCEFDLFKEYEYTIPDVEIFNIEQLEDTTFVDVEVKGNGELIDLFGVAYQKNEQPDILDNQNLFGGEEGLYRLPILNLEPENEYFFIAFAANSYAYGESEVSAFTVPTRSVPEVPCDVQENVVELLGTNFIQNATGNLINGAYRINANAPQLGITMTFSVPPSTGIYRTESGGLNSSSNDVRIDVRSGSIPSRTVASDGSVYIEKIGTDSYRVSFCDLLVRFFTSDVEMRGNITTS